MGAQCSVPKEGQLSGKMRPVTQEQLDTSGIPPPPTPYQLQRNRSNQEPDCCALCLQALAEKQLAVCTGRNGCRSCSHFFHASCLRRVNPRKCPQCRTQFEHATQLPVINEDPAAWARLLSLRPREAPSKKDVMDAFKAMLPLPPDEVEALLVSFPGWNSASDRLSLNFINILSEAVEPHLPAHDPPSPMHEVSSADDGHTTISSDGHQSSDVPGQPCSCGRIHAHRGDRVKRGPAFVGGMEDGGAGQLGTIVREEEIAGAVFVQWDRAAPGTVHCYAWPADPMQQEVEQVLFTEVAPSIQAVQTQTGLSSVAVAELLRRRRVEPCRPIGRSISTGVSSGRSNSSSSSSSSSTGVFRRSSSRDVHRGPMNASGPTPTESELRERPKLFHRVRVLPDQALVLQWFEACPQCPCTRPDCRGGVRWSTQASRHLGREGYLLKIDERDGTMLVEMTGRCNCKVWFPALAVQPVYDPDTADEPRFRTGAHIESKIEGVWHRGIVTRVWWRPSSGWGNKPSAPYSIKLFDGRCVFAPKDKDILVKAACISVQ